MKTIQLKRSFLFRHILVKQWNQYSEVETNVLIGIFLMNEGLERCSCNTLFEYLAKVRRTPYKKKLLATIRKLKSDGMVRILRKGPGTNMLLTTDGKLYLIDLEEKLRQIKFK